MTLDCASGASLLVGKGEGSSLPASSLPLKQADLAQRIDTGFMVLILKE